MNQGRNRILKYLQRSHHYAPGIMDGTRLKLHQQPMPFPVLQQNGAFPLPAIQHHAGGRAPHSRLQTAIVLAMHQQIAMAELTGHFMRKISADPLRAPVPVQDPMVAIDHANPFIELIQESAMQIWIDQGQLNQRLTRVCIESAHYFLRWSYRTESRF